MWSDALILIGAICLLSAQPAWAAPPPLLQTLAQAMQLSADAWNRNDLSGFMAIYDRSADTAFVSSRGVVKGFDAIRELYRKAYGGTDGLGELSYSDFSATRLSDGYAILYGRFRLLSPGKPKEANGVFDLVMHKTPNGWRILSDHTS